MAVIPWKDELVDILGDRYLCHCGVWGSRQQMWLVDKAQNIWRHIYPCGVCAPVFRRPTIVSQVLANTDQDYHSRECGRTNRHDRLEK